jgi:hypothetical protein
MADSTAMGLGFVRIDLHPLWPVSDFGTRERRPSRPQLQFSRHEQQDQKHPAMRLDDDQTTLYTRGNVDFFRKIFRHVRS